MLRIFEHFGIKKLRTEVRGTIKIEDFDVQLKP